MSDLAIRAEGLGKRYRIGARQARYRTLRETLVDAAKAPGRALRGSRGTELSTPASTTIWALRGVSFQAKQGEVIGIIGRNGAGKSTLLKILSRITKPTEGRADIAGRVGSLLEVGTGFHPELTGRENIYLNGAILGMRRRELDRKFDEIVAFAEIEKFLDTPVKHYSSGMFVRLAFAVAAHLDPEILVVDEVLSVGDAAFQRKSLGKMGEVAESGRTVLFVSHNLAAVQNLCQRGIVLDQGGVRFDGSQTDALVHYHRSLEEVRGAISLSARTDRIGSGVIRLVGVELRDSAGQRIAAVASGQTFDIFLYYESSEAYDRDAVRVGVRCISNMGIPVFSQTTGIMKADFRAIPKSGAFVCRIRRLPLPPSIYDLNVAIKAGGDYADYIHGAAEIQVVDGDFFGTGEMPPTSVGACLVDGEWRLER